MTKPLKPTPALHQPLTADADELHITHGRWHATVSPVGASLRRLWVEEPGKPPRDVVWGYTGTTAKKGGQGDVLMPWPGRIRDGKYAFRDVAHQLPRNDKDGPNAIHGFLRQRRWSATHAGPTAMFHSVVAASEHEGYPFALEAMVGYELNDAGLACAFVLRNAGATPAPVGAGFHPYLAAPGRADDAVLQVPASLLVPFEGLLPTGQVIDVPSDLDFRLPRKVGDVRLNHCLTGLKTDADGFARVRLDDAELWMDRSFRYLVLYTGDALGPDARKAVAVEPMTCATDAFNHPDWGLVALEPNEVMTGTWGITLRDADPRAPAGPG